MAHNDCNESIDCNINLSGIGSTVSASCREAAIPAGTRIHFVLPSGENIDPKVYSCTDADVYDADAPEKQVWDLTLIAKCLPEENLQSCRKVGPNNTHQALKNLSRSANQKGSCNRTLANNP